MSTPEMESIVRLVDAVWPARDATLAERLRKFTSRVEENRRTGFDVIRFVVWDGHQAIAHARTFERVILCPSGSLAIMGLAGVCVLPGRRGGGLGRGVAGKALGRVDAGDFAVSLFQTSVPGFYRKIGARSVTNRFVNSLNLNEPDANPWWDPDIMIYPAGFAWPGGTIDLKGPAY